MALKNLDNYLKIGFVLDDGLDSPDGVQQYILTLGAWLTSQGHDVRYLVGQTSRQDIAGIHSLSRNIRVRSNGGNTMSIPLPTSRRRLRSFLDREKFDVLHVQVPFSPFMGGRLILAASPETAIVGTYHIAPYSKLISLGNHALGLWSRSSLKRFDLMLSVSTAAAEFAKRTFHINSTILPNVIDYQLFHKAKPLPVYHGRVKTVVYLGRLVPRKGSMVLLRAARILSSLPNVPDFRIIICGRGPMEDKLRRYVTKHRLGAMVSFAGFITESDKPRYLASADISVFPSLAGESFGIVLLEAMASGKAAVLAGDNPGYRSVMSTRPSSLFDPRRPDLLAKTLANLLTDESKRLASAKWGADHSAAYDVSVIGRKLLTFYRRALQKTDKL